MIGGLIRWGLALGLIYLGTFSAKPWALAVVLLLIFVHTEALSYLRESDRRRRGEV